MKAEEERSEHVVVALGSNLGDSEGTLRRALVELKRFAAAGFAASSIWRSVPVDCPSGSPDFVNAVCLWRPPDVDTPEGLLDRLQALERDFGRREKRILNEPRPLDLDLVAFGRTKQVTPRLTLPHPRAHLRRFVLGPLHELAPDLVLPGWPGSVAEMLQALPALPGDAFRLKA